MTIVVRTNLFSVHFSGQIFLFYLQLFIL
uniref:Uncharacterized protein n=1 Tax=Anguilla anguilla TaxID=7936 RepID=A0A0E9TB67_ANGAN